MPRNAKRVPQVDGNPQATYARSPAQAAAQPPTTPSGRGYGQRKAIEQAMAAAPMQGALRPPPATPSAPADPLNAARAFPFPEGEGLAAPSTRPGEPLTAGMALGAGPGPEALGPVPAPNPTAQVLRILADAYGDPALAGLADLAESTGT